MTGKTQGHLIGTHNLTRQSHFNESQVKGFGKKCKYFVGLLLTFELCFRKPKMIFYLPSIGSEIPLQRNSNLLAIFESFQTADATLCTCIWNLFPNCHPQIVQYAMSTTIGGLFSLH